MTRDEFEERIGKAVAEANWKIIDLVYTWHPSIKDVGGKDQIAKLYDEFGMTVIKDMVPRAETVRSIQKQINLKKAELAELQHQLEQYM